MGETAQESESSRQNFLRVPPVASEGPTHPDRGDALPLAGGTVRKMACNPLVLFEWAKKKMTDKSWTQEAQEAWENIPLAIREKILKNVWCSNCRKMATIMDFGGRIENYSLILTGSCLRCGAKVARVLEGP